MSLGKHPNWHQHELFDRSEVPEHVPRLAAFERRMQRKAPKPLAWEGMGSWVRQIGRLLAVEQCSSHHFERFDKTARQLTVERIRASRHADDLTRVGIMLDEADQARRRCHLHGLDGVWSKADLGALRVEVRNRLHQLCIGRTTPKPKGPRFDPSRLPLERLEALIQHHPDTGIVEQLRVERERRLTDKPTTDAVSQLRHHTRKRRGRGKGVQEPTHRSPS